MTTAEGQPVFPSPREIVHVGYCVSDLESAIDYWTRVFGAGPFFKHEDVVFDSLETPEGPAVFDHSNAFGRCGDLTLELHEIHKLEPAEKLEPLLVKESSRFNHIAYLVDDPDEEGERLEQLGIPLVLTIRVGAIESRMHAAPWLGHAIELHRDTGHVRKRNEFFIAEAKNWDGSDPIRPMPGPPGRS